MGSIWGQWAFLPVTDGELLVERPTAQLLGGRVNGEAILIGVSSQNYTQNTTVLCA